MAVAGQAGRRAGVALHPLRFRGQALGAGVGELVVAAEPGFHDLFPVDLDEPALAQPVKDRVQRPGMQPDLSVRDPEHILDEPVAVLRPARQRGQHQERGFLQRLVGHECSIYA